ncbi:hypothetical protein RFI_17748, partial [Reticulomyxa filosa]
MECKGRDWFLQNKVKVICGGTSAWEIEMFRCDHETKLQFEQMNWKGASIHYQDCDVNLKCKSVVLLSQSLIMEERSVLTNEDALHIIADGDVHLAGTCRNHTQLSIHSRCGCLTVEESGVFHNCATASEEAQYAFLKDPFESLHLDDQNHILQFLPNKHFVRLGSFKNMQICGQLTGGNDLNIFDCSQEMHIVQSAQFTCGYVVFRSVQRILFNGNILNERSKCFFRANALLHMQRDGRIECQKADFKSNRIIIDGSSIQSEAISMEGTLAGDQVRIRKHEKWNNPLIEVNTLIVEGTLDTGQDDAIFNVNELVVAMTGRIVGPNIIFQRYTKEEEKKAKAVIRNNGYIGSGGKITTNDLNWIIQENGYVRCKEMQGVCKKFQNVGVIEVSQGVNIQAENILFNEASHLKMNGECEFEAPIIELFSPHLCKLDNKQKLSVKFCAKEYILHSQWHFKPQKNDFNCKFRYMH